MIKIDAGDIDLAVKRLQRRITVAFSPRATKRALVKSARVERKVFVRQAAPLLGIPPSQVARRSRISHKRGPVKMSVAKDAAVVAAGRWKVATDKRGKVKSIRPRAGGRPGPQLAGLYVIRGAGAKTYKVPAVYRRVAGQARGKAVLISASMLEAYRIYGPGFLRRSLHRGFELLLKRAER